MADSLSLAMLVLLESLSPEQRAVLLLHDVFDYDYPRVAEIVGKSRGQRPPARHPRPTPRRAAPAALPNHARAARRAGSPVLCGRRARRSRWARGAARSRRRLTGDGGGKVPALARTLSGRNRVARTLINWIRLGARLPGVSLRPVEVNGGPGALFLDGQQRLIGVMALDIAGGEITGISSIVNPDKLTHLGPVADVKSLLRSAR